MARTRFATEVHDTPQKSSRIPSKGQPSFIVIHHAATESFRGVVTMELGTKQVSSTVVIKDGQVASMFDEAYRAWSLSSQEWDSKSLSSETCNSGGAAQGWPISEASYRTLARVVADWCVRYAIPCNRERVMGHREVYSRYGASYATACPGGINLDRVVADAAALIKSGVAGLDSNPIEEEEKDMPIYELVQDVETGTGIWFCVDRINRYHIDTQAQQADYQYWLKENGQPSDVKTVGRIASFGAVVANDSVVAFDALAVVAAVREAVAAAVKGLSIDADVSDADVAQIASLAAKQVVATLDIPSAEQNGAAARDALKSVTFKAS